MIDTVSKRPLTVDSHDGKGGLIDVPVEQLEKVRNLLDANRIKHWLDEEYMSVDDGPEMALIYISRTMDAAKVQQILDSVP